MSSLDDVALCPINVVSLCAGLGGNDLGLHIAEPATRTVVYVEREAYAAHLLAARCQKGPLDPAPIFSDLTQFDGRPWCGVVDIVSASIPCTPFSSAGAQRGRRDERWLWPHVRRIIEECKPAVCFFENVTNLAKHGALREILGDLSTLGYDAEWDVFSAAEVGAPQRRRRLFILAHANSTGPAYERSRWILDRQWEACRDDTDRRCSTPLAVFPPGRDPSLWKDVPVDSQPSIHRVVDGSTVWRHRLFLVGNSVCPLAVALSYRTLAARASLNASHQLVPR
jgi:DNA (cytosine-5)-methyltransferase 1